MNYNHYQGHAFYIVNFDKDGYGISGSPFVITKTDILYMQILRDIEFSFVKKLSDSIDIKIYCVKNKGHGNNFKKIQSHLDGKLDDEVRELFNINFILRHNINQEKNLIKYKIENLENFELTFNVLVYHNKYFICNPSISLDINYLNNLLFAN